MILERDTELEQLRSLVQGLSETSGRVVLIRGEAGIGKSTLVGRFVDEIADHAHVLIGTCDDLLTPEPLGPMWDIGRDEPTVAEPLAIDDRRAVMEAVLALLSRQLRTTLIVLEDTQWADEATLDVITFLGRRMSRTNGLLVLTFRDGEVDTEHPLRRVIGDLPPQNLVRMHLEPLSTDSISSMIGDEPFDPGAVEALTGGNPLFVTEVLASGTDGVPASVRDSVLARAAKVSSQARKILDLASVTPGHAELDVIEDILQATTDQLSECVRQGLLQSDATSLSFCHELQRRAIESSLSTADRRGLNHQMLTALSDRESPARLVHYAREANDVASIIELAPRAARAAVATESHREALAHYRMLGPLLDQVPPAERAVLLEEWAQVEYQLDHPEALDIVDRAIELYREQDDERALARTLAFAVRVNEVFFRPVEAEAAAAESVAILQELEPSADLAHALSQRAWLRLMQGDDDKLGIALADEAIAVAEACDDDLGVTRALILKGSIGYSSEDRSAVSLVEEGLRRATLGGHRFDEVYALINIGGLAADVRDMDRAVDFTERARNTAARYEMRALEAYASAMYAEQMLWRGDWAAAENAASDVLESQPHTELIGWRVLGTLETRRGGPGARNTLDRMLALAEPSGELQNIDPAAATLAEYMWLTGDYDETLITSIAAAVERGRTSGFVWPSGALAFWAWKVGIMPTVPNRVSNFYRWIIDGDWQRAAEFWSERGIPYERGLALMHGDDAARIEAVHVFEDLGATATARRVRQDLTERGVNVPRGRSQAARSHAAGLTARQAEVLDLLAEQLTNPEIADRLFVSQRTVENHVAAILMKLAASNRDDAVATARRQDLLGAPTEAPSS